MNYQQHEDDILLQVVNVSQLKAYSKLWKKIIAFQMHLHKVKFSNNMQTYITLLKTFLIVVETFATVASSCQWLLKEMSPIDMIPRLTNLIFNTKTPVVFASHDDF